MKFTPFHRLFVDVHTRHALRQLLSTTLREVNRCERCSDEDKDSFESRALSLLERAAESPITLDEYQYIARLIQDTGGPHHIYHSEGT